MKPTGITLDSQTIIHTKSSDLAQFDIRGDSKSFIKQQYLIPEWQIVKSKPNAVNIYLMMR